jgi:hypothetical protein
VPAHGFEHQQTPFSSTTSSTSPGSAGSDGHGSTGNALEFTPLGWWWTAYRNSVESTGTVSGSLTPPQTVTTNASTVQAAFEASGSQVGLDSSNNPGGDATATPAGPWPMPMAIAFMERLMLHDEYMAAPSADFAGNAARPAPLGGPGATPLSTMIATVALPALAPATTATAPAAGPATAHPAPRAVGATFPFLGLQGRDPVIENSVRNLGSSGSLLAHAGQLPGTPNPAVVPEHATARGTAALKGVGGQLRSQREEVLAAQVAADPQESGLLTQFLPFDRASLEAAIGRVLGPFEELGGELVRLDGSMNLWPGLMAFTVAVSAAGLVWRLRRDGQEAGMGTGVAGLTDADGYPTLPRSWSWGEL